MEIIQAFAFDFDDVYKDMLMQFPASELKNFQSFQNLLKNENYKFFRAKDKDTFVGYVLLYEDKTTSSVWIDYIAVLKTFHCRGYGTAILKKLMQKYEHFGRMFLEVEKPDNADIKTLRRIKFYSELGAKKLDINYFYPNNDGGFAMDLFFFPLQNNSYPSFNESLYLIKSVFNSLHSDVSNLDDIYRRIC